MTVGAEQGGGGGDHFVRKVEVFDYVPECDQIKACGVLQDLADVFRECVVKVEAESVFAESRARVNNKAISSAREYSHQFA